MALSKEAKAIRTRNRKFNARINKIIRLEGIIGSQDKVNAEILLKDRFIQKVHYRDGTRRQFVNQYSIKRLDKMIQKMQRKKYKEATDIQKFRRLYGQQAYRKARINLINSEEGVKSFRGSKVSGIRAYAVGGDATFYNQYRDLIIRYNDLGGRRNDDSDLTPHQKEVKDKLAKELQIARAKTEERLHQMVLAGKEIGRTDTKPYWLTQEKKEKKLTMIERSSKKALKELGIRAPKNK